METYNSDSDEAPEEFSFQTGKEEHKKFKDVQSKEITKVKQQIKKARKLNHERNKAQKDEKRQRLDELESKKISEEFLNRIKDSAKENTIKNKNKYKNESRKRFKKNDEFKRSVNDSVVVQVLPQKNQNEDDLKKISENFRNAALYNNKDIKRVPSRNAHKVEEKLKHGGRTELVSKMKL